MDPHDLSLSPEPSAEQRNRDKAAAWYEQHRAEVLGKYKQRYAQTVRVITDEAERQRMREDPRLALREETVVCLVCWQELPAMLNSVHLKLHGLTTEKYKLLHGYNQSTALVSKAMAAKLSARRRGDPHALAAHGKKALAEFRATHPSAGGLTSLEARLDASDRRTGVAQPDLTAVPSADIVSRWLFQNQTTEQIAQETGLTKDDVHQRFKRIFGLYARAGMRRVHGEIVSDQWLDKLAHTFGDIVRSQIARPLGVPSGTLYTIGKRRKNLALTGASADRLIRLDQQLRAHLFFDKGRQAQHFAGMVPDLAVKHRAAAAGYAQLRALAGLPAAEREAKLKAHIEELCAASQLAIAKGEADPEARAILLWLPELLAHRDAHPHPDHFKPYNWAVQFLAHDYQTKGWVVQEALAGAEATEPRVLHAIVNTSFRAQPEKREPGRPRSQDVTRRQHLVAAFELVSEKQDRFKREQDYAAYIFPDKPGSAYDALRKFKSTHKRRIEMVEKRMTLERAEALVRAAMEALNP